MRKIACAMFMGATLTVTAAASAAAGDTKTSPKFTEPRLGLGADVPDDLLFGDSVLATKPRSRVTVRSRKPKTSASKPILNGWAVKNIEVHGDTSWQVSEAVRPGCLDPHAIMNSLAEAGWSEFSRYSTRPRSIAFNARRRDGRTKRVQIDRCSGEIIHVSASYTK